MLCFVKCACWNTDAQKRKSLPLWIREGLEKMEMEKRKANERERKKKQLEEEKAKREMELEHLDAENEGGSPKAPRRSRFVRFSSTLLLTYLKV